MNRFGGLISPLMMLRSRLVGTVGAGAVTFVLGAISGIVLARILGPTDRGHLAILLLWPQLVSSLGSLGVDLSTSYYAGDRSDACDVTATALRLVAVRSVASGAACAILIPVLTRGDGPLWLALLLVALIPVDLVALVAAASLNGRHDHRMFNILRVAMPLTYTVGVSVFAAIGSLTVMSAAIIYLASNALTAVLGLYFVSRFHGIGKVRRDLAHAMASFGLRSHFGRLTPQSLGADLAIVGLLLGAHDAGLFAAAIAFLGVGRLLTASVGFVVYPEARAADIAGSPAVAVRQTMMVATVASAAVACALWLLGPTVAGWVFGSEFRLAGVVAAILATGEVAGTAYSLLVEALRGGGQPGLTSVVQFYGWLVFLPLTSIAAALGGLAAVATAVATVNAVSLCILVSLAARRGSLSFLGMQRPVATTGLEA